ncbi:MAG: 50S ribosomal protein L4 [Planctomycetota bacterium]|nr:MAG: 50S ribosomal protein L4 [Planctomycetota bacterium]
MVAIPVYDHTGAKTREIELDPKVLDKAVRKPLLKEALIAYLASQRQGSHSTKTRSEVAGGGHKPWRQKGTGRARAGTTRGPIWVGGGRAHGPKSRDYSYRLPRKQRQLALRSSLRFRLEAGQLFAVEGLEDQLKSKPATKLVSHFLKQIGLAEAGVLFVNDNADSNLYLSARNIQKVEVCERRNLSAGPVMQRTNLVFTAAALESLVNELQEA